MKNALKRIKKVEIIANGGSSPAEMIRMAVSGKADISQLRELLDIQKEWEANEAKKAYNDAMARVHEKMPTIVKLKTNNQTNSKYANLDSIIPKTKDVYAKEGFALTFYEGENAPEGNVRICADVTHRLGHTQTRHYDVPLDGKGIKGNVNMTAIHAKASSTSYGRRYLMCLIFNIPTNDDNDGNNTETERIGDKELHILRDLLVDADAKEPPLCKYLGIEKLEDMKKEDYSKAKIAIETRKKAGVK